MFRIGIGELIVILLIVLLVFGASRLPEIGRALGKAIKEFKKEVKGKDSDDKSAK
ncbi:MAG: twin-arginine translocase TatA/TatE family subunit [Candidatus Omnitrophica bacterium]|nr:twin-arginine translocase TatA/TatE family subunit [Candidatus Omnitrophota bacterium]MDD5352476.1 twin-arginine translocase TatA/TatE family subunit [Candidatus Omnitrophota bacterium]MDD5550074.1 twin-arginine translocase TatA/TatE family subunit [Candidatus Omnitrophota bacterium]